MKEHLFLTGPAGTGKTTQLLEAAQDLATGCIRRDGQRVLAITFMHGARRRLESRLRELHRNVPAVVDTIDGLALGVVNRWRRALGYSKRIIPSKRVTGIETTDIGIRAGFDHVLQMATRLLRQETVGKVVGATYPLVLVDEFQDCSGARLEFIEGLAAQTHLLLALDDFQRLESREESCPALDWAMHLCDQNRATIRELSSCLRTADGRLLAAAACLRTGLPAGSITVPVMSCPGYGLAAWHIIHRLVLDSRMNRWEGSAAVITPSRTDWVQHVLDSTSNQLREKGRKPLWWHIEPSEDHAVEALLNDLCIAKDSDPSAEFSTPSIIGNALARMILDQIQRLRRLRGWTHVTNDSVMEVVGRHVHSIRAYGSTTSKRLVTTVHGAKNREFDYVFVLWPYHVKTDPTSRRKLLYNAITRARKDCIVLVQGNLERVKEDPVLGLLGPAENAFRHQRSRRSRAGGLK